MYQNSIDYVVKTKNCLGETADQREREGGGGGGGPDSSVVKAPASGARCRGFGQAAPYQMR